MQISKLLEDRDGVVFSVGPDQTIAEFVEELNRRHVGALVVLDAEGRLLGIVSERNIPRQAYDTDTKTIDCARKVREIMWPRNEMPVMKPTARVREVLEEMRKRRTRHMVIVDESDKPLGVVSVRDIIEVLLDSTMAENEELQKYMYGY